MEIIYEFEKNPAIINKLILCLDESSLYYEDTVDLCTKMKLYQSLSYICSVHGDFISPATKILYHCQEAVENHYENASHQTFTYLKEYLLSILNFKYPSSKEKYLSSEHRALAMEKITIWITFHQTL